MNAKNLWIMSGIPGSGKTTYCKEKIKKDGAVRVSRDDIRFALIDDDEEYFSHEDEVFREFIKIINEHLANNDVTDIYVDATHLNEKSRNKVLDKLHLKNTNINVINFLIDCDLAIKRNNMREGRAVVPEHVIRNMLNGYKPARAGEKYHYQYIMDIKVEEDRFIVNGYLGTEGD